MTNIWGTLLFNILLAGRSPGKQGNLHDDGFPDFLILTEKVSSAEFGTDVKACVKPKKPPG